MKSAADRAREREREEGRSRLIVHFRPPDSFRGSCKDFFGGAEDKLIWQSSQLIGQTIVEERERGRMDLRALLYCSRMCYLNIVIVTNLQKSYANGLHDFRIIALLPRRSQSHAIAVYKRKLRVFAPASVLPLSLSCSLSLSLFSPVAGGSWPGIVCKTTG